LIEGNLKIKRFEIYYSTLIVLISLMFGVFSIELIYKNFFLDRSFYKWGDRYMLFAQDGGGTVFKNIGEIFTYQPNATINSKTYYNIEDGWVLEYEYSFRTNNLGLVQSSNVGSKIPSILLLGDSYTEGQGSAPWFEILNKNLKNEAHQYVNGGLLATGPSQWLSLHNELLRNLKIKKIVAIGISPDYSRIIFNFPKKTLSCIEFYSVCDGDENFYGLPNKDQEKIFLEKLKSYRESHYENHQKLINTGKSTKQVLAEFMPASFLIYSNFKSMLGILPTTDVNVTSNSEAIQTLIEAYGDNFLFIHLPSKAEIFSGQISPLGRKMKSDIHRFNGNYFDGFSGCNLGKTDFFKNDGHPNQGGYAKIAKCVEEAIKSRWSLLQVSG
jgi:hypothetical protein